MLVTNLDEDGQLDVAKAKIERALADSDKHGTGWAVAGRDGLLNIRMHVLAVQVPVVEPLMSLRAKNDILMEALWACGSKWRSS